MTQSEARSYISSQIGGDAVLLSSLLDSVAPTTLAQWTYVCSQYGHTSPQELREMSLRLGAFTGEQED
jgi:hypothetical protein